MPEQPHVTAIPARHADHSGCASGRSRHPCPCFPLFLLFPSFLPFLLLLAALFAFPCSCGKRLFLVLPPPFWPIPFDTAHSGLSASVALSVFKRAKGFCACVDLARPCNLTSPFHTNFLCAPEQASLSFFSLFFEVLFSVLFKYYSYYYHFV